MVGVMNQISPYVFADAEQVVGEDTSYVLKLRDLPEQEKPREKLIKYGPDVLSAAELLAIVLGVGTKKEEVLAMAHRILAEYGDATIAYEKKVSRLRDELAVPEAKACQIVACFELGRRYFKRDIGRSVTIRTPEQVYEHVRSMAALPTEHLRALYLNNHYRVVHDEVISIGSMTAHIVHPRDVFRPAVEYGASAVVLAHNHPSGALTPSTEDIAVTKQLQAAGEAIGIELLDHIIVGTESFISVLQAS